MLNVSWALFDMYIQKKTPQARGIKQRDGFQKVTSHV